MTIDFEPPEGTEKYGPEHYRQPCFRAENRKEITGRVMIGLENILFAYSELARRHAQDTDNNPQNYTVKKVYVVGSAAAENKVDSDLDLVLLTPGLGEVDRKALKTYLALLFYTNREKQQIIDVFFIHDEKGLYPGRPNIDITDQVQDLIDKYNALLKEDSD